MKTIPIPRIVAAIAIGTVASYAGRAALVQNPSFESNYNDTWPHYGSIDSWVGGSGVNDASGPFHNNGTPIPDLGRVAFGQGGVKLSQEITGLAPGKQYFVQFLYDARACCGGTLDIVTKWNDAQLGEKLPNVRAVTGGAPFQAASYAFTAEADSGNLAFQLSVSGDATALFDGVTIVQRDKDPDPSDLSRQHIAVINPSFEASGSIADDVVWDTAGVAGWVREGSVSVATAGVTTVFDNGSVPDQDNVLVLTGPSTISQVLQGIKTGSKVEVTIAYNAKSGSAAHLQIKSGATVLGEVDATPVGGNNAFKTKTISFTAADVTLPLTIAQTTDTGVAFVDDIKVVAGTGVTLKPIEFIPTGAELAPSQKLSVSATVDPVALQTRSITLKLRSPNTGIAKLTGADQDGVVSLEFAKGGDPTKTFEVEAVGRGVARIEVVDAGGLKIKDDVTVSVITSFVRNSSFESNARPGGVGYGAISAWNGGSGLNKADGPFHDNGVVPDRDQVAFLQGAKTLSQTLYGLTPGENYWLQFRYNARAAGETKIDLSVKVGGKEVANLPNIAAVGPDLPYYFASYAFVPESASVDVEFATAPHGDATLLLDAVSVVKRPKAAANPDIVIENPSFEADGSPEGVGYLMPRKVAGWELAGGYGVNLDGVGPFTDNGLANDQDRVLFIQGGGSVSQPISGLVPGEKYTLSYSINSRNCCTAGPTKHTVTLDDLVLQDGVEVSPVGGREPFHRMFVTFTAAAEGGLLRFQHVVEAGDHSLLLDNIRLQKGVVLPELPDLKQGVDDNGARIILWDTAAADGAHLESAPTVNGPWTADAAAILTKDANSYFVIGGSEPARFYRLVR